MLELGVLGSLALLLFLGWIFGRIVEYFTLPSLVGMLLAGICLGPYAFNLLSEELLELSPALRTFALVIILLRAGLSLSRGELRKIQGAALGLSVIPCLFEGITVLFIARLVLGIGWAEAGVLGFTLAAVSPAVVVPGMLALRSEGYGKNKQIPAMLLAGASLDDVFAITFFGVFLLFATGQTTSVAWSLVQLPWSIFLGILGGVALGLLLVGLFQKLTLRDWEKLLLTLVASLLFWELSEFFSFAGLLGIMVMGLVLREKPTASAQKLEVQLSGIWLVAQIALFSLVGAEVNVGLLWQAGLLGLIVIVIGLLGRSVGVWVVLSSSNLNAKERIFCIISYLPKATVQAAIGGIPLSLGLASGELILAISALAILLTAPLGATGIRKSAPLLLEK